MYTESCVFDEDHDIVLQTIYAAKKYMVSALTTCAVRHLVDTLATCHVCHVLDQATILDEASLVSSCMAYLRANARMSLTRLILEIYRILLVINRNSRCINVVVYDNLRGKYMVPALTMRAARHLSSMTNNINKRASKKGIG